MPKSKLLIAVKTELSARGTSPKKFFAKEMSSSKPKTLPIEPSDAPKLRRLSWQFVNLLQLDESPPKLNPMNGVMNPSACAGKTERASSTMVNARACKVRTAILLFEGLAEPMSPQRWLALVSMTRCDGYSNYRSINDGK